MRPVLVQQSCSSAQNHARAGLEEVLQRAGFLVLPATNIGTAVDELSSSRIDLLITHPYIDSMSGNEAASYLRERNPDMAVLIVAGLLDDDHYTYQAALENFRIFPQPFTTDQFLKEVRDVPRTVWQRESANVTGAA